MNHNYLLYIIIYYLWMLHQNTLTDKICILTKFLLSIVKSIALVHTYTMSIHYDILGSWEELNMNEGQHN